MEELRKQVEAMGVSCGALNDDQVESVAKALGLNRVSIKEHKGALYVVTEGYEVPHKTDPDRKQTARGLFLRVEAIPQVIADLKAAMGLLQD